MNVWRGSWGTSWLASWRESVALVVRAPGGAGKLNLPYFEPAWATLKPQNVRYFVSRVGLFLSVRSTVSRMPEVRSRVAPLLLVRSLPSILRNERSVAELGFDPRVASTVHVGAALRGGPSLGVGARSSFAGAIGRQSRASVTFMASSKQTATAAHRSAVPLFASARSAFSNRRTAAVTSRAALFGSIISRIECATTISRIAEIDRRDIDLIMLLAA